MFKVYTILQSKLKRQNKISLSESSDKKAIWENLFSVYLMKFQSDAESDRNKLFQKD